MSEGTRHLAPGTWHLAPGTWQVPVRSSLADKCSPSVAALVIVDMVNDFVHPRGLTATRGGRSVAAGRAAIEPIRILAAAGRAAAVPVVHVQHSTLRGDASHSGPWVDARRRASYSALDICLDGTWGQQVVDELAPEDGDIVVKKHRYSGFARTELDRVLGERGRETIVVCGVSTNVCVESTARQGFDLDYYWLSPRMHARYGTTGCTKRRWRPPAAVTRLCARPRI